MLPPSYKRIASRRNPQAQKVRALREAAGRRAQGRFLVEGRHSVEEALKAGWPLAELWVTEDVATGSGADLVALAAQSGAEVLIAEDAVMSYVSTTDTPQGLAAIAAMPATTLQDVVGSEGVVVLLDGIQDPGNVGTVLRAAAAAGARGVVLVGDSADPYQPKVVRASQGALFGVPVIRCREDEALEAIRAAGLPLAVAVPRGGRLYWDAPLASPVAIAVGGEIRGVSPGLLGAAAHRITIPMAAGVDSLNAAVAAALLLFEGLRQRQVGRPPARS